VKRAFDIVGALVGLILTAPLTLLTALAIAVTTGRPVLFRQTRPGRGEQPFVLLKFRTMRSPAEAREPEAARLTGLGRFLRATSLDEIPQLLNVLRGEMSLVGPRPLLTSYLPYFTPTERRRFEVRPGIAGWAQLHGRNRLPWAERFTLDVWYVDHRSLRLDGVIILKTMAAVLSRRGYLEDPETLMENLDTERSRTPADDRP
jgi:lipopolysaccharide/colanic/teichoic acid biosynthesis glycosyltransferase